jgi:molybdopterin-biosynthesis enzyme MoeA-like protein
MARIPQGASLIENPVSIAPGFSIGNVHVMAGVPSIFQAMLDNVSPLLKTGVQIISRSIDSPYPEGTIGTRLAEIQKSHPDTAIGSYPRYDGKVYSNQIVIRSRSESAIAAAAADVESMFEEFAATG